MLEYDSDAPSIFTKKSNQMRSQNRIRKSNGGISLLNVDFFKTFSLAFCLRLIDF